MASGHQVTNSNIIHRGALGRLVRGLPFVLLPFSLCGQECADTTAARELREVVVKGRSGVMRTVDADGSVRFNTSALAGRMRSLGEADIISRRRHALADHVPDRRRTSFLPLSLRRHFQYFYIATLPVGFIRAFGAYVRYA